MTNFGTSEESASVLPSQLEPGVRISGDRFDMTQSLIVQNVGPEEGNLIRIEVGNFYTGEHVDRWLRKDRPIDAWGRL